MFGIFEMFDIFVRILHLAIFITPAKKDVSFETERKLKSGHAKKFGILTYQLTGIFGITE